ncbi:MAG: COG4280 domain-containing protein [Acidimicrobiales bacterium]
MTSSAVILAVAVFAASCVEMIEALTIVLAVGVTRGWRSTMQGVGVAIAALVVLVAALGPAIVIYVPLSVLRIVVGALLLVFGLQWLRKAVLRATGDKAKHDEDAIYAREVERLSAEPKPTGGYDGTAFTVAFKGVFLEGVEIIVVVLTLGLAGHRLGLAVAAAAAAVVLIGIIGLLVSRRLSEVPENAMKMGVGIMLVSFGTFWMGEGVNVVWPGSDLFILALIAAYGATAWLTVSLMDRSRRRARVGVA